MRPTVNLLHVTAGTNNPEDWTVDQLLLHFYQNGKPKDVFNSSLINFNTKM